MLSIDQVAERLGVTRSRVYALIHDGRLQATKLSGVWLVKAQDADNVRDKIGKVGRPPRERRE